MTKEPLIDQMIQAKIPGPETRIAIKKTICPICSTNCGMNAYISDGRVIKVEGDNDYPMNNGKLCAKGAAVRQYIYHPDRIRTPLLKKQGRNSDQFEPISWDEALDIAAARLSVIKKAFGPESVVFFSGYPKLLRPFLQRLAHGFGSPNFCSESSTCFFSTVMANKLNYGCDFSADLTGSKCLLIWSSNMFHSKAPMVKKILAAVESGVKLIDVGPLVTPLTRHVDIHLRIRPGTSGALALGMAHVIIEEGLYDKEFVENWSKGFEEYRDYVKEFSPYITEQITGVPAKSIIQAAKLYGSLKPAAIMTSASPTVHHTNGLQNHRAITALVGLTGNFDRPGGSYVTPRSYYHNPTGLITREREFEQPTPFEEMASRIGEDINPVWTKIVTEAQALQIPFQVQSGKPYPIKAMVAFGLNYRMWPGSDFMRDSLKKLDYLIDVDLFMTDSVKLADLVLPCCTTFERSDLKILPSRYALWTRPVIKPLGESRPDYDIIIDLADRLGLNDSLLQKGQEACLDWIFEPSGFKISEIKKHPNGCFLTGQKIPPMPAFEKYKETGFCTPSGKMEFYSSILEEAGIDPLPRFQEPMLSPISTPDIAENFPLILTTGARLPMFMHSRTFRLPWMRRLRPDPMVDINPQDAVERGISQGAWIRLSTPKNSIRVKANLTEKVPPRVANMYHGYPEADVNILIEPDYRDPVSGFAGFKSLLCEITRAEE